jgi:protease-4
VDALKTRDELRQLMIEKGAPDETAKDKDKTFRQVNIAGYLSRIKPSKRATRWA